MSEPSTAADGVTVGGQAGGPWQPRPLNDSEPTRPGLVLGFAFWAWMVALGAFGIAIHGSAGAAEARFLVSHGASGTGVVVAVVRHEGALAGGCSERALVDVQGTDIKSAPVDLVGACPVPHPVGGSVQVLYDPAGKHGVWEAGAAAARAPDRWLMEWSIGTVVLGAAVGLTSWGLILRRRRRAAAVAVQPGA